MAKPATTGLGDFATARPFTGLTRQHARTHLVLVSTIGVDGYEARCELDSWTADADTKDEALEAFRAHVLDVGDPDVEAIRPAPELGS
jgi:hypothetical protein